jgi:hypothetical protein
VSNDGPSKRVHDHKSKTRERSIVRITIDTVRLLLSESTEQGLDGKEAFGEEGESGEGEEEGEEGSRNESSQPASLTAHRVEWQSWSSSTLSQFLVSARE